LINLVKNGPESIFLTLAEDSEKALRVLEQWGEYIGGQEALSEKYSSRRTVAVVSAAARGYRDRVMIYVSDRPAGQILTMLINEGAASEAVYCCSGPGRVILRLAGTAPEAAIEKVRADFSGKIIDNAAFYRTELPSESTVISFTFAPIVKDVPFSKMLEKAVLVRSVSTENVVRILRLKSQSYLKAAMEKAEWNNVEIQIGDKEGRFETHYSRVLTVIQSLQLGIIVNEVWKREYIMMGKTAPVYVLNLMTPLHPRLIKEFMMGLEHLGTAERVADIDIYHDGKKVSRKDRFPEEGLSDQGRALNSRNLMLEALDPLSFEEMEVLDSQLDLEAF
jgi:hypothetical protein